MEVGEKVRMKKRRLSIATEWEVQALLTRRVPQHYQVFRDTQAHSWNSGCCQRLRDTTPSAYGELQHLSGLNGPDI